MLRIKGISASVLLSHCALRMAMRIIENQCQSSITGPNHPNRHKSPHIRPWQSQNETRHCTWTARFLRKVHVVGGEWRRNHLLNQSFGLKLSRYQKLPQTPTSGIKESVLCGLSGQSSAMQDGGCRTNILQVWHVEKRRKMAKKMLKDAKSQKHIVRISWAQRETLNFQYE